MSTRRSDQFNDDEVRAVIARATELDGRGLTTSDEIRAIASELGISRAAMEAALQEHARAVRPETIRRDRLSGLALTAVGVPLGVAAGALLVMAGPLIGVGVLGLSVVGLGASAALVLKMGRSATVTSFQVNNLLLWAGIAMGSVVTASLFPTGALAMPGLLVGWCLRSWVTSSILGSAAVIAVRRAINGNTGGGPGSPNADGRRRGPLDGVKRVYHWLLRKFRRGANTIVSFLGRPLERLIPLKWPHPHDRLDCDPFARVQQPMTWRMR
jgi:hypothetical protein